MPKSTKAILDCSTRRPDDTTRPPRPLRGRAKALTTVVSLALLTACSAAPPMHTVPPTPSVPPLSAAQREAVGIITLGHVTRNADLGASLGGYRVDSFCAGPIAGVIANVGDTDVTERFRATFARVMGDQLGFRVAGEMDTLFRRTGADSKAEFVVAARIEDLRFSLCRQQNLVGRQIGLSGEATARIAWRMLDRKTERLIYDGETVARGAQMTPALVHIEEVLLTRLFQDALIRLAADNRFRRAVISGIPRADALRQAEAMSSGWPPTAPAPWAGSSPASGLLTLTGPPLHTRPFSANADRIRAATITILGMTGHGSGFFVTHDGWALTNNHVVTDNDVLRVRLVDGRELWARVVRRHPLRDVALLRVAGQGLEALPIRPTLAQVSETTYAIGTPMDRALGQTVSQGIISAWRPGASRGLDVYQATTPVHRGNSGGPLVDAWGNVVAITVSGLTHGRTALGSSLSFFIPVHDALRHLGLTIVATPGAGAVGAPPTVDAGGRPGPWTAPSWTAPHATPPAGAMWTADMVPAPSRSSSPGAGPAAPPRTSLSVPPPPGGAVLDAPPPPAPTSGPVPPGRAPLL